MHAHGLTVRMLALLASVMALGAVHATEAADTDAAAAMKRSFVAKGQAGMDRLEQDETQASCTRLADGPVPADLAARLTEINRATIKPPADGAYLGDYTKGETIAQTGTGKQSSDDPAKPSGGNCYACHELAARELAYGTIGPSLRNYASRRGTGKEALEYTWGKLYNSNATQPCSLMPRFGHRGILTEQQLKDLMAYLLDPQSPVNQ